MEAQAEQIEVEGKRHRGRAGNVASTTREDAGASAVMAKRGAVGRGDGPLGRRGSGMPNFFATCTFLGPVGVVMGMLRFFLLGLAAVFVALGALTVFRSPDWSSWKLALLAGEFGHWFAVAAVA